MEEQRGSNQQHEYQGYYQDRRGQEGMQQQHPNQQYYHPHMPQGMSDIYGYPIDPGWGNSNAYPPAAYGYQYPLQHMEGVPLPPGIPGLGGSTDPLEAVLGPFPCVRLRNLPYDTSLEDILVFFQGLVLIDVVLVGQGEAFVIFANPMDFQMALQRNRQTIGRRFVDIGVASRADYYEAVAHLHEQESGPKISVTGSSVLSSGGTGLPQRGDGRLVVGDDQQPVGDSVAALWGSSSESTGPSHSMQTLSGSSGVQTSTAYDSGMASVLPSASGMLPMSSSSSGGGSVGRGGPPSASRGGGGLHAPLQKRTGGGIQVGDHTGFLRMRGLPFSATKEDIIKFFLGFNPVPESVVLTYRNDGRATGEAYIGFYSPEDAKRAMDLHRRMMGNRYIELFISNKDEQGRALARFGSR